MPYRGWLPGYGLILLSSLVVYNTVLVPPIGLRRPNRVCLFTSWVRLAAGTGTPFSTFLQMALCAHCVPGTSGDHRSPSCMRKSMSAPLTNREPMACSTHVSADLLRRRVGSTENASSSIPRSIMVSLIEWETIGCVETSKISLNPSAIAALTADVRWTGFTMLRTQ
ncbi:hypothetical protein ABW21_db0203161 [Orbilia brochopaga]|nr:hypothetical protein ABW21_db0203161 [Drechslerella brochopaga]